MRKLGVLGAGSWGTALAVHLAKHGRNEREVMLWVRRPELAAELVARRENHEYLPEIELPPELAITSELEALATCDVVLVVVPSHGYRQVVRDFLPLLSASSSTTIVSATKGIETETLKRMSEVTLEEARLADRRIEFGVLAGPSFAAELARDMPTAAVVAAIDHDLAMKLRTALSSRFFRLYSTPDVVGVELAGTTKNVIAIAAGVVAGLNLGHNTLAALLTRGLHEITRLAVACGGDPRTLAGLAGMGDLILTCTGALSRNRALGVELAHGRTLAEISGSTSMVAEGVRNSQAVSRLAERLGVEMPITREMVEVLYNGKHPRHSIEALMTRNLRAETEL